jgi:hypothetical protein
MAIDYSTLRRPINPQVVDPSSGRMRDEWQFYFDQLTTRLNASVGELGVDPAPQDAQYLVGASNATLTAERVVTDTATVTWDLATAAQAKANVPNDAITYAKIQNVSATDKVLGRQTAGAGDVEEITCTSFARSLLDDTTAAAALATLTAAGQGKQSIWVPAAAMYTSGSPSTGVLNVGGAIAQYLAFDPTTTEFAFFNVASPKSWDAGTLTAEFIWTHPATVTNFGVQWACGAAAFADNTAFANVYVSQNVVDTGGTTSNIYRSPETAAIDPGNTQAKQDLLAFFVAREATSGSDTLAVDAYLVGVMLHYTTNAATDA